MKRTLLLLVTAVTMAFFSGCCGINRPLCGSCKRAPETCRSCRTCGRMHGNCDDGVCRGRGQPSDPGAGYVSYPYYTTHGPRDFLARNPQSIGP